MKQIQKNRKRIMAGTLAAAVVTAGVGIPGVTVHAADQSAQGKEEVIYIMTGADGRVDSVNAVNIFGKGDVTDYGDYSSVKMLNTTDAIHQDGDKITFSTDKEKVYYQGTMKNVEIPWKISFTYTLDGKEFAPEELAGKSGELSIRIKIEKNEACETDFYDSSALQVAMTLDTEKCEKIQAEGATLANVGSDKQISYTILPGKGLDVTVTADVTDFEMDAVAINGVKLDLNLDIDDEELMEKVTEIMDASRKLNDGASELSDGTDTLKNGGSSLSDGAAALNEGAVSLDNGMSSLNSGVTQMQSALDTLNVKSATLTGGSRQMLTALKQVQTELGKVSLTTEQLQKLTDSSAAIKKGISDAYDGAAALQAGLSYENYKAAMQQRGLDIDQLQAGNTEAIQTLSAQIQELSASVAQLKSLPDYDSNEVYQTQVAQMESQISSLQNILTLLNGNNAAISGTEQYFNATSQGASELVTGLAQLKESYEAFDTAINTFAGTLSDLAVNVSTLKNGIDQLVKSYEQLDGGIGAYTDGVASVAAAYSKITEGTKTLAGGSQELAQGSATLKKGASDVYEGIVSLYDGASQLNDGTQEFYEKTDGMDTKIEDTIDGMIDSISGGDQETESFVSEKNENVESVQFVIKTAAIEKPEVKETTAKIEEKLNFVEKLLKLFGL